MRIFYPKKSGQGYYNTMYGRSRAVHTLKRGENLLLTIPNLASTNLQGVSDTPLKIGLGVNQQSDKLDNAQKIPMENIMDKLQKLQVRGGGKKKNISFVI